MPSIIPCVHKSHCVESSSPSGSEALSCWPLHVITTLKMHSLHNALSWGGSTELMMGRNGNVGNSDIHAKSSLQCIQVVDKFACRQIHWHCYQSLHHKQCCSSKRCLCFITHGNINPWRCYKRETTHGNTNQWGCYKEETNPSILYTLWWRCKKRLMSLNWEWPDIWKVNKYHTLEDKCWKWRLASTSSVWVSKFSILIPCPKRYSVTFWT